MKLKQDLLKISTLIASIDNDSKEWLKSPPLRAAWHRFFWTAIAGVVISWVIGGTPISDYLSSKPDNIFWFRVLLSGMFAGILILLFNLTIRYFAFTIMAGRPVRFNSVFFFYFTGTLYFSLVYLTLFFAEPTLYQYDTTKIHWNEYIGSHSMQSWKTRSLFILYSALKSVGSSVTYVESNSVLVSIVNYIQTLFTFGLVSLLIAGYVNQKSNKNS